MSIEFKAPNYVKKFRCLGGECEDTCCQHWDIHYDRAHFETLVKRAGEDSKELAFVEQHITRLTGEQASERHFAKINFASNGYCSFLEADGLCHIHRCFGVEALSNVCAFYPRVVSRWGQRVEVAGALSCPEMVRQCLSSDTYLSECTIDAQSLPRQADLPLAREIDPEQADDYLRLFMNVRETLVNVMLDTDFPIETRLYAMASLAQRLSAFYRRGARVEEFRVQNECVRVRDPQVLETLDDFCARFQVDEPVSMVVVQSILQLRLDTAPDEKLAQLIREIVTHYGASTGEDGGSGKFDFVPATLWEAYQAKTELVNEVFGVVLEDYLTRYVVNCLYREWFVSMPDAFSFVQMLIIRVNLLRFLLMSSPKVEMIAASVKDKNAPLSEDVRRQLQDHVVYVIYNFARSIDHNMPFLQILYQAMNEQQMITFDFTLPFIKG